MKRDCDEDQSVHYGIQKDWNRTKTFSCSGDTPLCRSYMFAPRRKWGKERESEQCKQQETKEPGYELVSVVDRFYPKEEQSRCQRDCKDKATSYRNQSGTAM